MTNGVEEPTHVVTVTIEFHYAIAEQYVVYLEKENADVIGNAIDAYLEPEPGDEFTVKSYDVRSLDDPRGPA